MATAPSWRPERHSSLILLIGAFAAAACGSGDATTASSTIDSVTPPSLQTSTQVESAISCTPAPEGTESIITLPPWEAGVERTLELRLSKRELGAGTEAETSSPVRVSVKGADEFGWQLEWEVGTAAVDRPPDPSQSVEQRIESLFAELPHQRILYRLDTDRVWQGVDNPGELRASIEATYEKLREIAPDDRSLDPVVQMIAGLTDDQLAVMLTEEPRVFHTLEGWELFVGEVIEYPDLLQNSLGGEPFPAVTTVEIVDLEDEMGCVTVRMRVTPDVDTFIPILMQTLSDAMGVTPDDDEIRRVAENFEIENEIIGRYDVATGFFREIVATQRISDGTDGRLETKTLLDVTGS